MRLRILATLFAGLLFPQAAQAEPMVGNLTGLRGLSMSLLLDDAQAAEARKQHAATTLPVWVDRLRDERVVVTGTGGLFLLGGAAGLLGDPTSPAAISALVAAIPLLAFGVPKWTVNKDRGVQATKIEPMVDGALSGAVAGFRMRYF